MNSSGGFVPLLMHSDWHGALNIGYPQSVAVEDLVATVSKVPGRMTNIEQVTAPAAMQWRNFSNERIYSLGWRARVCLENGTKRTHPWVEAQANARRARER